jgi:hypothetical protein
MDSKRTAKFHQDLACRNLWAAVVDQALSDIDECPYDSTEYDAAVAFFMRGGVWGRSRAEIADQLGLHPDDLRRAGACAVAKRESREPPPPKAKPAPRKVAPIAAPSLTVVHPTKRLPTYVTRPVFNPFVLPRKIRVRKLRPRSRPGSGTESGPSSARAVA